MLADLFLAVLIVGAVMIGIGFVETLRTGGRSSWPPILVGLTVVILGIVLRAFAIS